MDDFFSTIYYYINYWNFFYGVELDNYLYKTVPGYLQVGLITVGISLAVTWFFYYVHKPVRRQWPIWFGYVGANAILNFAVALGYTITPLINHEIDASETWRYSDAFGFGVANVIWDVVASLLITILLKILMLKWGSPAKYIPFIKF